MHIQRWISIGAQNRVGALMRFSWIKKHVFEVERWLARSSFLAWIAVKVRNQANIVISLHLSDGPHIAWNGEKLLAEFAAPSSSSFVDVGANAGEWSVVFASNMREGHGLCIEPGEAIRAKLTEAVAHIENVQIRLIDCAVSDAPATAVFWEHTDTVYSGLLRSDGYGQPRKRSVQVRRLDEVLTECGWASVDFLKIDTEGLDFSVIRGAGRYVDEGLIRVIQFEYGSNWREAGATLLCAVVHLDERGYTTFALKADGLHPIDPAFIGDYFMFTNFVAIRLRDIETFRPLIQKSSVLFREFRTERNAEYRELPSGQ